NAGETRAETSGGSGIRLFRGLGAVGPLVALALLLTGLLAAAGRMLSGRAQEEPLAQSPTA
ncbi:MAG TPA: hypothetical protein VM715_16365, partial [Candidatus Acidoferrum sp.]|nr:hypothetical protein [Candidatus Acidoferrum sp.]